MVEALRASPKACSVGLMNLQWSLSQIKLRIDWSIQNIVKVIEIPCKKIIGLVNIKGRESRGIIEGLDIAFAENSTNGNVSTLHNKIEGIWVGSFLLDSMRSRL